MKYTYLLCLLMTCSFSAHAQMNDQKVVSDAVERLKMAMIDANKPVLEEMTDDSLSYGHSSGRVENKSEFIGNILSGKSDFVSIELSEQSISVTHHIAIVRHLFNAVTNDSGIPGTVKLKILLIWEKEKGVWKLLARQAVKLS